MTSLKNLFDMNNKVVLISGGAGYLGTSMCEALSELGATLIIGARDQKKCQVLADRLIAEYNNNVYAMKMDVMDLDSIKEVESFIKSKYNRLDVLINNAWSGNKNSFESITKEDWKYDIDMSLNSVFDMTKTFFPLLHGGVILNITSMYGHVAPDYRLYDNDTFTNPPSYGAAKAAIIQYTKYLASFLSPYGIRSNCLSPGAFPFPKTKEESPEFISKLAGKTMLNRIGEPEDLKGTIALLCTDASKYMTGQNICVDGGWTAW